MPERSFQDPQSISVAFICVSAVVLTDPSVRELFADSVFIFRVVDCMDSIGPPVFEAAAHSLRLIITDFQRDAFDCLERVCCDRTYPSRDTYIPLASIFVA